MKQVLARRNTKTYCLLRGDELHFEVRVPQDLSHPDALANLEILPSCVEVTIDVKTYMLPLEEEEDDVL